MFKKSQKTSYNKNKNIDNIPPPLPIHPNRTVIPGQKQTPIFISAVIKNDEKKK